MVLRQVSPRDGVGHIRASDRPCLGWQHRGDGGRVAVEGQELHYVGLSIRVHVHDDAYVVKASVLHLHLQKGRL